MVVPWAMLRHGNAGRWPTKYACTFVQALVQSVKCAACESVKYAESTECVQSEDRAEHAECAQRAAHASSGSERALYGALSIFQVCLELCALSGALSCAHCLVP
eukprot:351346-Chlamydomonas_euryale.AAC.1